MKLRLTAPARVAGRMIRQFGQACLVRHRNGRHELAGGSAADRAAALEWTSLFAHEIVFTHRDRPAGGLGCGAGVSPRRRRIQ